MYMKPPLTDTFAAFHHKIPASNNPYRDQGNQKSVDSAMDFSGMNPMGMQMMMNPMMSMMMAAAAGMQSLFTQQQTLGNPQTCITVEDSPPSSQSADPFQQPYPSIRDFLTSLDPHYPARKLIVLIRNFEDEDYFYIHEIVQMDLC
jgi:hypothetical protein